MFLDEPTSGLDATTTMEILGKLRTMSRLGMTVISVVHQPRYDAFLAFDQLLLLGVGGVTVYIGPADKTVAYFSQIGFQCPTALNPADFFMDVIAGHYVSTAVVSNIDGKDLFE